MLIATVLVMLLGPSAEASSAAEAGCGGVKVEVSAAKVRVSKRHPGYSAREVGDLQFQVKLPGRLRDEPMELWVYTPKGYLYQSMALPLPEPKHPGKKPLERQVEVTFPVDGTLITQSGLYGKWRIEAHVNRAPQSCGEPATFILRP